MLADREGDQSCLCAYPLNVNLRPFRTVFFLSGRIGDTSCNHIVTSQGHPDSVLKSSNVESDASHFGWHVMKYELGIGRRVGFQSLDIREERLFQLGSRSPCTEIMKCSCAKQAYKQTRR